MADTNSFEIADLTKFCGLDNLGLKATGQLLTDKHAKILCEVDQGDEFCKQCGALGKVRDTVKRELAHTPLGWRPTKLVLNIRRYQCRDCHRVWQQDTSAAAEPRAKISRAGVWWGLFGVSVNHLAMASVAKALGVAWNTANSAVLTAGVEMLINDPARFNGVKVIGVDEHVWSHVSWANKYVTVIIDLTPVRDGTGPSRLLDMIPGKSKAVFKTWLDGRPQKWRDEIEIVAMDGFTGFKTAANEELPQAEVVMDPFHVVRLAGDALEEARRRTQQETLGRRGRKGDPLYGARHTLMTGSDQLREKQWERLEALFDPLAHAAVEATWQIYQKMIAAYRNPMSGKGREQMIALIELTRKEIPAGLDEIRRLGRTLNRRKDDILAYFKNPKTSNGPTEAINGRLEHLRGIALGFRDIINYRIRALLECGGFRPQLHAQL
ncbi:MAG: ISL3 family transposase [Promicromonosporaceae bacterium]|nr:ISL3 family transposase [Promicromonosporaceae bacterium]